MSNMNQSFKSEINVKWVKGESGTTYLCPVNALNRIADPTEADLMNICVDESHNPENA